jgi:hypothetical protein
MEQREANDDEPRTSTSLPITIVEGLESEQINIFFAES